jgi:hypothetical protein
MATLSVLDKVLNLPHEIPDVVSNGSFCDVIINIVSYQ